jgi:hypothetical protein
VRWSVLRMICRSRPLPMVPPRVPSVIAKRKETWFEAEVSRIAGEIAKMLEPAVAKAEAYFERALAVARAQQAKS